MSKRIFPGNFVTNLSSYQGQCVIAVPGRQYYHKIGYALVDSTGGTSFDVIIPSPDKRDDDKPRANITGLVVPDGATVYSLGLRVTDNRKEKDKGDAASGPLGTNSASLAVASTTVAPGTGRFSAAGTAVSGAKTLKVFVTDSTGASAGSALTSTATGGSYIICEVSYYLDDDVATTDDTILPYLTES
jgi:hypothetical protein